LPRPFFVNRPAFVSSLDVLQPVDHNTRDSGNDLAVIRMITGERCEDKLAAVRHLDIRDVVTRSAGPTCFGPQAKSCAPLERNTREAVPLIVGVITLPGV